MGDNIFELSLLFSFDTCSVVIYENLSSESSEILCLLSSLSPKSSSFRVRSFEYFLTKKDALFFSGEIEAFLSNSFPFICWFLFNSKNFCIFSDFNSCASSLSFYGVFLGLLLNEPKRPTIGVSYVDIDFVIGNLCYNLFSVFSLA